MTNKNIKANPTRPTVIIVLLMVHRSRHSLRRSILFLRGSLHHKKLLPRHRRFLLVLFWCIAHLILMNLKRLFSASLPLSNFDPCSSGPSISQTRVNLAFADFARVFSQLKGLGTSWQYRHSGAMHIWCQQRGWLGESYQILTKERKLVWI